MIVFLKQLDTELFLFLNQLHTSWLDPIMFLISKTKIWIPLYFLLAAYLIYKYRKKCWVIFLSIALLILLSDRISSGIIKPAVNRLRPSHVPELKEKIHIVNNYRGGKFGFVSSHAANTFALFLFLSFLLKNKKWTWGLFLWAFVVSYSRIYLGVHYPGDVICGAILGMLLALVIYRLMILFLKKYYLNSVLESRGST